MTSMIQDYAITGAGCGRAPVAKTGSSDFLCWPRFDSDAGIAARLSNERLGYWRVSPTGFLSETTRRHRDDTTILGAEHLTDTGRVHVTDLKPGMMAPTRSRVAAPADDQQAAPALGAGLETPSEVIHRIICERDLFLSGPVIQ